MNRLTDHNFHTFDERLEAFKSYIDKLPTYFKRNQKFDPRNNVCTVRTRYGGKEPIKEWFYARNIVTDIGDQFYAEQIVETATPTNDFLSANHRIELQNPASADTPVKTDTYANVTTPIVASRKIRTSGYPKVDDDDVDNTGGDIDIVTWAYSWTVSDFNTEAANNITGGAIHNAGTSPVGGSVLLTHFNYAAPFEKTSSDTLKTFINHRVNGS